ncbi:MAG: hypothetical protein Q8P46_08900 [Hyphomicrobiales bacterium]|nr:hypothetical protein [Hyphomicrobiales bacterium]
MSTKQTNNRKQRDTNPPKLIAYHVEDRGRGRKFWTRLGAVWEHKNGEGLTLFLNVLPVDFDGRIVLLPPREEGEEVEAADDGDTADESAAEDETEEVGA